MSDRWGWSEMEARIVVTSFRLADVKQSTPSIMAELPTNAVETKTT